MISARANAGQHPRGRALLPALLALGLLAAPALAQAQFYNGPAPGMVTLPVMTAPGMYAPGNFAWVVPFDNPYWFQQAQAFADSQAMSNFALAQGSYNLSSMEAGTNWGAGNLVDAALMQRFNLSRAKNYASLAPRFNIETGSNFTSGASGSTRLVDITSRGGDVLWPLSAPTDGDLADKRKVADVAIRDAISDFRRTGNGSVEKVNTALRNLTAYAEPAAKYLKQHDPDQLFPFMELTRNLDRGLRKLVGEPPRQAPHIKGRSNAESNAGSGPAR